MAPQLQLNQGPQDALLYDNNRSYFTNVGYVRTSNFQVEYQDISPSSTPQLGGEVTFTIPKAADLLGPVDLMCQLEACDDYTTTRDVFASTTSALPTTGIHTGFGSISGESSNYENEADMAYAAWVDEVGYAMIDEVEFIVGNVPIEKIKGEQLQIENELMTGDEARLGGATVLKTGRMPARNSNGTPHLFANKETPYILGHPYPESTSAIEALRRCGCDDLGQAGSVSQSGAAGEKGLKQETSEFSRLIWLHSPYVNSHRVASDTAGRPYGKIVYCGRKRLLIPLNLFFCRHPSQYFPIAAVAGCNDVKIRIKFKPLERIIQLYNGPAFTDAGNTAGAYPMPTFTGGGFVQGTTQLRCHYVHVTGTEATYLMNKEHVRLLKLYQPPISEAFIPIKDEVKTINLNFLHPITTLIVTLRIAEEMTDASTNQGHMKKSERKGMFNYHGDGRPTHQGLQYASGSSNKVHSAPNDLERLRIKLKSIELTINNQKRHSNLSDGIETHYLKQRLIPMLHSNAGDTENQMMHNNPIVGYNAPDRFNAEGIIKYSAKPTSNPAGFTGNDMGSAVTTVTANNLDANHTSFASGGYEPLGSAGQVTNDNGLPIMTQDITGMHDENTFRASKNIFVYPFSLAPEGSNPSGAVNFSKVSSAQLKLHFGFLSGFNSASGDTRLQVDVHAVYYNWLQVKQGRAILSFQ